jgi:hypothetical protein
VKPAHARYCALLALACGAAVLFAPLPFAVAGGLTLALALPGFALTEALLRGRSLARVERVVLAPALSLALLVLGGLVIYVFGFKLDRIAWTSATVGVTLIALFGAVLPAAWAAVAARFGRYLIAEDDDDGMPAAPSLPKETVSVGVGAPVQARPAGEETVQIIVPRGKDDTLFLPAVVLEEQAQAKVAKRAERPDDMLEAKPVKPPRRLVWQAAPLLLVVALLGGASWLSFTNSRDSYETTVTALSAAPSGPVNAAGTRAVAVTVSGLVAADGPYSLVATGTTSAATVRRTITVPENGYWTDSLTLPGSQRITIDLYRSGDTTAYRTLYISAVQ